MRKIVRRRYLPVVLGVAVVALGACSSSSKSSSSSGNVVPIPSPPYSALRAKPPLSFALALLKALSYMLMKPVRGMGYMTALK